MIRHDFHRLRSLHRTRCLLLKITLVIATLLPTLSSSLPVVAITPTQAAALQSRHPDAGIWVMYRGQNTVDDLQKPYIKGAMAYVPWNLTYTGPNRYNWSPLNNELDFIVNQAGKKAMLDLTAGYCPSLDWPVWMREQVAGRQKQNGMGCHPLQFWDPIYIDLYQAYIRALATHLAHFDANDAQPEQTDITFVRAAVMADDMENMPNDSQLSQWQWQDFTPAPNGRIHRVDLTRKINYAYQAEITLTYHIELARAYAAVGLTPPAAVAKGGSFWQEYPTRDRFVAQGIWMDKHSGSPNPQGWYYDMYMKVKSGATRGTSETGGKSPENLLTQYAYWEILANLHFGVEFIGIYGNNRFLPDLQPKGPVNYAANQEAMEFGERYAGHFRKPETSPGAWIALRGSYPEERYGGEVFARRMWTNYATLMGQYRPQESVLLFGMEYTERQVDSITPIVRRVVQQPWLDEVAACLAEFPSFMCDFVWQRPDMYLGETNGYHEYTYQASDLGKVVYCGADMFCENPADATRIETMLWARRTNGAGGFPFMRFDLNDRFANSLDGRVQIRVVYLDQGHGQWELRYDSLDNPDKPAVVVQKQNSNQWKEALVDLHDVAFANRMEGGTDLSLYNMGDDDDIFHLIEVLRAAPEEEAS